MKQHLALLLTFSSLVACRVEVERTENNVSSSARPSADSQEQAQATPEARPEVEQALATFAGGCFWCMETPFEVLPGVSAVISGYTGGEVENPTYDQVCSGSTGHAEAIQVSYDPGVISYESLLEVFWRQIDPTDAGGQFVDRGTQYRSGIWVHDAEQELQALASRQKLAESGRFSAPIVTEIEPFERFWEAEEYHQDFYEKSPARYKSYRKGSGRDKFCNRVWAAEREFVPEKLQTKVYSKPSDEELRERLSDLQYRVTQQEGTEPAFKNEYWDNHAAGIYVDVVSGEPLFSSTDKFDSGTGWPSFSRPLESSQVKLHTDNKLRYPRDEVRSKGADSHLGHVFDDGPAPTGLRYCINSAALRFIPAEDLVAEGFPEYVQLFEQ